MGCKRGRKPKTDKNYRKSPKGQSLRKGESYREDKGLFYFQYRDSLNRKRVIYRKDIMALRKIEDEVKQDLADNIRTYEADHMTINDGFERYMSIKYEIKAEMEPDDKLSGSDYDEEPVCDKLSRTIKKAILHHEEGVDLIPGNIELAGIEVLMVNLMSRELLLKTAIRKIRDEYDYIIIDCMPSLGMLTINALAASDAVIIPVQAAYLPAKGLEQFLMTVIKVRRQINRKLEKEK